LEVALTKVWRSFPSTKKSASESSKTSIAAVLEKITSKNSNQLLQLNQQSRIGLFLLYLRVEACRNNATPCG
jgi:hypothetical protein